MGWVAGTCGGGTLGVIAWLVLAFFAVMRKGLFNVDWVPEGIAALVIFTVAGGIAGAYYGWKHFANQEKCQGRRNSGPLWRQKSVPPGVIGQHKCLR